MRIGARTLASCVALFAGLSGASADAYQCKRSETNEYVTVHWKERRIAYAVEEGLDVSPLIVTAAFATWSVEPCTDITFTPMGTVAPGTDVSLVRALRTGWLEDGHQPEQIAITTTFYNRDTGELAKAEIILNEELYSFADVSLGCPEGEQVYDYASVLTHEAGHFIGLDHTTLFKGDESDPTMAPTVEACGLQKRSLAGDDIAGLCRIYPSGEGTQACASLPVQAGYVEGEPFGCRAGGRAGGASALDGVLLLLFGFALRPKTCGWAHDRG